VFDYPPDKVCGKSFPNLNIHSLLSFAVFIWCTTCSHCETFYGSPETLVFGELSGQGKKFLICESNTHLVLGTGLTTGLDHLIMYSHFIRPLGVPQKGCEFTHLGIGLAKLLSDRPSIRVCVVRIVQSGSFTLRRVVPFLKILNGVGTEWLHFYLPIF